MCRQEKNTLTTNPGNRMDVCCTW